MYSDELCGNQSTIWTISGLSYVHLPSFEPIMRHLQTVKIKANILKARNRRFCNGQSACQLNPCDSQGQMEVNEGQCHEFGSAELPDERLCLHNDNIENNPDMKFNGFA